MYRLPDHLGVSFQWRSYHWQLGQEERGHIASHGHEAIDLDELAEAYATRLKAEIDQGLTATRAQTNRIRGDDTTGSGAGYDIVQLVVGATAVAGAYVVWKEVAADIRETVRRLRRISLDHHALVDEGAALVLAVDAVAEPGTFADLTLRFIAPLRANVTYADEPPRGYLVALEREGTTMMVVIDPDGVVVGRAENGIAGIDFGTLGL